VQAAVEQIDDRAHTALVRLVREYIFVGHLEGCTALIQQASKLFTVNVANLSQDLMFQQSVRRFGQQRSMTLEPAVPIGEVVLIGLEAQEEAGYLTDSDGSKVSSLSPTQSVSLLCCRIHDHNGNSLVNCYYDPKLSAGPPPPPHPSRWLLVSCFIA
jgi:hypothetical protein